MVREAGRGIPATEEPSPLGSGQSLAKQSNNGLREAGWGIPATEEPSPLGSGQSLAKQSPAHSGDRGAQKPILEGYNLYV